ncbi:MAG: NAD-dependent epimerase/dehydratase family protein [Candidatus Edwardsbacteria bacterium]|nr:NAD-dependent epimerase/dehydratase family protein [Candidatus Edwardsbacteria bacterium]
MTDLRKPSSGAADLAGRSVLITGGLGFIGSTLARRCLDLGAAVTVYDSLDPNSGGNLYNIAGVEAALRLVRADILDFTEVCRAVTGQDILFNCAASTSHPFSMREPWVNLNVNSKGVINLLEAARRFNPGMRFTQLGTSTQLGPLRYRPADENHPEFPTDMYSANKSVSEKYVLIYGRAYGMPVTVVRLPNVYGPRASIHSPEFTFVNYFIGQALQQRSISIYGDGRQLRNLLYVDDAAEALTASASQDAALGQVLFAAGDQHLPVVDIARTIAEVFGSPAPSLVPWPAERRAIEVGDAVISNARIKSLLGWAPRIDFAEGARATRDYYRQCLNHYLR